MERTFLLLHLVLVVNDFKDTGAELGPHLAEDTISFEALDHEVFQFVHVDLFNSIYTKQI